MKHLRRICGGFLLVVALSIPAFAGETNGPPGITGDILGPGLSLIISILL